MPAIHVTQENFAEITAAEQPVLLDFWAPWCGPCRMVSPLVDQLADEHTEYCIGKINVDEEGELAQQFGIMSIPTLIVMRGGEVVQRVTGARSKSQILDLLQQ